MRKRSMYSRRRRIRFDRTGGPDVLRTDHISLSEPKGNEVLIRVEAIGLSRTDVLWREGRYLEDPVFPAQIGYDAAGTIEAVGPNAVGVKVGDEVSTFPAVSLLDYGAHGEAILYPEHALLPYPENLSPIEAAAVNTGLFTAYFALVELAELKQGQFVVVTAASSSTGIAALQLAKKIGAKSIALTRSLAKVPELIALGAEHVLLLGDCDVRKTIVETTDGLGADVVYDAVAGPGLEELVWGNQTAWPDHCLRSPSAERRAQRRYLSVPASYAALNSTQDSESSISPGTRGWVCEPTSARRRGRRALLAAALPQARLPRRSTAFFMGWTNMLQPINISKPASRSGRSSFL